MKECAPVEQRRSRGGAQVLHKLDAFGHEIHQNFNSKSVSVHETIEFLQLVRDQYVGITAFQLVELIQLTVGYRLAVYGSSRALFRRYRLMESDRSIEADIAKTNRLNLIKNVVRFLL